MRFKEMKEQNFTRKDKFMLEKFRVLSESPLYRHSLAVDQYKDLLNMINFTKIADMLHLITHYGAVSAEQIKNFEKSEEFKSAKYLKNDDNQKQLSDLLVKKSYTDKYLKQYSLKEIDCSLNEMFPKPICLHNERRWYTVAARMLLNVFIEIRLEINYQSNRMHFIDEAGNRQCIDDFSVSSFAEFLEIVLHTSNIFDYQLDWSEKDLKKFLANLQEDETFVTYE